MQLVRAETNNIVKSETSLVDDYSQYLLENNYPEKTIVQYICTANNFNRFVVLENRHHIGKGDVLDYLNQNPHIAPHTWNNYLTYLKQFFKFLRTERGMQDLTDGIRQKKVARKFYKKSLPQSVILELYQYFENRVAIAKRTEDKRVKSVTALRNLVFFGVLISVGSRAGQTTYIKIKDIDSQPTDTGNVPSISIPDKGKHTSSSKPVPQFVFTAIEEYLQEIGNYSRDDFLFRSFKKGGNPKFSISYNQMYRVVNAAFIAIGVKNKSTHKHEITLHSLRHSLAELIFEKHGLEYLQDFYNHSSSSTTRMYAGRKREKYLFENPPDISSFYQIK